VAFKYAVLGGASESKSFIFFKTSIGCPLTQVSFLFFPSGYGFSSMRSKNILNSLANPLDRLTSPITEDEVGFQFFAYFLAAPLKVKTNALQILDPTLFNDFVRLSLSSWSNIKAGHQI